MSQTWYEFRKLCHNNIYCSTVYVYIGKYIYLLQMHFHTSWKFDNFLSLEIMIFRLMTYSMYKPRKMKRLCHHNLKACTAGLLASHFHGKKLKVNSIETIVIACN